MAKTKTALAKTRPRPARMTGSDAVFAELDAMTRREKKAIAARLLEWIEENELA